MLTEDQKLRLEHAVLNQIEGDLKNQEYDAASELLQKLIELPEALELLKGFLSATALKNWKEERTFMRY